MKQFCTYAIGVLVFLQVCTISDAVAEKGKYAHITQDAVRLDLDSGDLFFNEDPVSLERFDELLKDSYSVYLRVESFSGERVVPANPLQAVIERMAQAAVEPKRIQVNLFRPSEPKKNQSRVMMGGGVKLFVKSPPAGDSVNQFVFSFSPDFEEMRIGYDDLHEVFTTPWKNSMAFDLEPFESEFVKVSAQIFQVNSDGERKVLTRPMVTVKPGHNALVRVVKHGPGWETYLTEQDEFHQEDLASMGVQLSVTPRIIGDYVRLSGVIIINGLKNRVAVFEEENVPVYSYSSSKMVVPFSVILPPGKEFVEFAVADEFGKPTMCRIEAHVEDEKGMTMAERERVRAKAGS